MKQRRTPKVPTSKPIAIAPWPSSNTRTPAEVAAEVEFVGSPEHKDYVNPITRESPAPRAESDGSRCPSYEKERWAELTEALRAAVRAECTSALFEPLMGGDASNENWWPRYVWGWFEGRLFQARRRTDPPGNRYKGWFIPTEQRPVDPHQRLEALRESIEGTSAR
jgi:hypothetical protein